MNKKDVRRTARVIVSALAILVAAGLLGRTGYTIACGTERWAVKTGGDVDAGLVDLSNPAASSVSEMNTFQRPGTIPRNNRADWVEATVFQVYATLTVYKRETDEDYHPVLQDDDGSTMIVEIPRPACVSPSSPLADYIANARAQFDAVFRVTTQFQEANVPVVVTGVGFWDFPHGQRGAALNLVELHPMLDIQFP